jgi:hypothetical protein
MTESDEPTLILARAVLRDRGMSLTSEEVEKVVAQYTSGRRALERVRMNLADEEMPAGIAMPSIRPR